MLPHIVREIPGGHTAVYAWFEAMHTRVDLLLKGEKGSAERLTAVAEEVRSLIAAIEREGNCFDPNSTLARLNRLPVGESIAGGKFLYDMLLLCKQHHTLTHGLFDVTVESEKHSPDTIDAIILHNNGTIGRGTDKLKINLSGFIKGYALDCIRPLLAAHGVSDAIVNMGNSSVMALGDVPVRLERRCLTTSGNPAGRRLQIIDPRSNTLVERSGTVQVATDGGAEGEALATALFISAPFSGHT